MGSEGRTAFIDELSQESLKKENVGAQTQSSYTVGGIHPNNNGLINNNSMKIFVGGLPGDLTLEEFKAYFEQYGSIEDIVVMSDKLTNKPRGFGFVTYESQEIANNVLKERYYELKNKRVEVKKAVSKERMSTNNGHHYNTYNYNTYNGMYYGNTAYYGNYGGYYGMNDYGYGAYNGVGYGGLSYVYNYPYQGPNYANFTNTYMYQSPYNYGNTPFISTNPTHIPKKKTVPIVIKKKVSVKDGDDSDVSRKNVSLIQKEETESVYIRPNDLNDVLENNNGDGDHGEISEGLSLLYNRCGGDDAREIIEDSSFYINVGLDEQVGADGQSTSSTTD